MLISYDGLLSAAAEIYADGEDLKHPLISPLYGDFSGFPPTILISGTRDLLLSDTVRAQRKLRDEGIIADLHVFEGMSHAGYLLEAGSPEAISSMNESFTDAVSMTEDSPARTAAITSTGVEDIDIDFAKRFSVPDAA